MKKDTKIIHGGKQHATPHHIVNTPVYRASTVVFDNLAAVRESHTTVTKEFGKALFYGRKGSPTTWTLEDALTELEEGFNTILTPSGLSAVTTAILSVVKTGDHLLMVDSVYEPSRAFCEGMLKNLGVETTYYDPLIGAGIADLFKPNTKLVFLESPGSHTFEVQDVPAIAAVAHEKGAVVMIDNTWASPLFHKPLTLGADMSIQACTKYVVGHSDVLLGSVTANERVFPDLFKTRSQLGVSVSSDDAYLATRGLRTLGVRLRQHQQNALIVAEWLEQRPEVKRVLYPPLPSDPGHELWKRDFTGGSGLMGVVFTAPTEDAVTALVEGLQLFSIGYSWGGYESLVCHSAPARSRTATGWNEPEPGVRLHIGLEDPEDLIADLEAGFARYTAVHGGS